MIRAGLRIGLFAIAAVGLTAMVASLFLQVLAREFNWAVDWTEESARFTFIAMVFIAAAYATLTDSHLRVSVVSDLIARRIGHRIVGAFHALVLLGFALLMIWFSAYNFWDGLRFANTSPALRFNQNILFSAMTVGFTIMAVLHMLDLIRIARGDREPESGEPAA